VSHLLRRAGGVFGELHRDVVGPPVDLSDLRPGDFAPALVDEARQVWAQRLRTEFRSVQIMARFLEEVAGAGDPLDVYAGAIDLVRDEVRHTELCMAVCQALGVEPRLPDPVALRDPAPFLAASMGERALHTALTMLAVSETLSVAFIRDLQTRCDHPPVRRVLDATLDDEASHESFGWAYVAKSLERFPRSTRPAFQELVHRTLAPHEAAARPILARLAPAHRTLDAWPDAERIQLGLFSPERQALVYAQALPGLQTRLAPLDLWPPTPTDPR
jgi:hypothetical protein